MMDESIELIDADRELLDAACDDEVRLGTMLGAEVAADWVDFPDALAHTRQSYSRNEAPRRWSTIFFVHRVPRMLVGWGGYKGPPRDGIIEIGYAVAPSHRRRGLATAAARQMIRRGFADEAVLSIDAHTLAEHNASTRILNKLGFDHIAVVTGPFEPPTWRWRLKRTDWRENR